MSCAIVFINTYPTVTRQARDLSHLAVAKHEQDIALVGLLECKGTGEIAFTAVIS